MPGGIRTFDLRFRRPTLYPTELQAHDFLLGISGGTRTPNLQFRRLSLYPVELQRHNSYLAPLVGFEPTLNRLEGECLSLRLQRRMLATHTGVEPVLAT